MRALGYVKQKGLSLVEMLISMSLGAVVTVGVIQLFTANSETYNLMQGQSRMQEGARFSLDFLGRAIQQAGYKGCFSENEDVYTTIQFRGDIPYEFQLFRGIQAYDWGVGDWNPVLTPLASAYDASTATVSVGGNAIDIDTVIEGTDVLTIRYASQNEAPLFTSLLTSSEDVVVTIPAGGLEFVEDDMVMIHDCEKSTIFRITKLTDNGSEATLEHDTFDAPPLNNSVQRLAEVNTFETETHAAVSAIRTSTFFIAPGAGVNNVGDTPLSLWRRFGTDAPVELVEGVEDLQVLFGTDTDNDGTPNQYLTANLVTDFTDVQTVRISITVNSVDEVGATSPPTHGCTVQSCISGETFDGLVRRTFHQTIQVRNKG
ncbi:MAG: PilW family protein [Pseudomonadales bacterium]